MAMPAGSRLMILAPVLMARKGEQVELFQELQAQGFVRVRVRADHKDAVAEIIDISEQLPELEKNRKHSVDVVVDRVKVNEGIQQRLAESFETALRLSEGRAILVAMDSAEEKLFSSRFACPVCSHALPELEPRLFSFNNPAGACPSCDGLGVEQFFDPARIVQFPSLSLAAGAIKGWDSRNQFYFQMLNSLAAYYDFAIDKPWEELDEKARQRVLYGSGTQKIPFTYAWCTTLSAATAKPIPAMCVTSCPSSSTHGAARLAKGRDCVSTRAMCGSA